MTGTVDLPLADTSDMISLHRVFREALDAAPTLLGGAVADRDRAAVVANFYDNVLRLLHSHHEGEDELLTPLLLERRPDAAEVIARVAGQHATVLGALDDVEAQLPRWAADPSATATEGMIAAVADLNRQLCTHLDDEERDVLPVAGSCINVAEWGALPEHSMRTFTGDKMWLIIGLVQEQMTHEQIAIMQAHMPPAMLEFWQSDGTAMFESYVTDLRGPSGHTLPSTQA